MSEITTILKDWGVTIGLLSAAATFLVVILVLSLREFFFWFSRANKILKTQIEMNERLQSIEQSIQTLAHHDDIKFVQESALASAKQFPLNNSAEKVIFDS